MSQNSHHKIGAVIAIACVHCVSLGFAAETIPLWPEGGVPGATGKEKNDTPTLTLHHSEGQKPSAAVLLCPGGGYKHISGSGELVNWFRSQGIATYVLKYRLPVHGYQHPAPLQDAQRAMRTIRRHAEAWGLDHTRIGVMGFSSGGHVASTLMTHYDTGASQTEDPIETMGCRPDFAILMCPVVTFGEFVHGPSKARLLGQNPSDELVKSLSNELQVTKDTPPTFFAHCKDDGLVKPQNSQLMYDAMLKAGVKAEIRLYEKGGHGVKGPDRKYLWLADCEQWLKEMKIIPGSL